MRPTNDPARAAAVGRAPSGGCTRRRALRGSGVPSGGCHTGGDGRGRGGARPSAIFVKWRTETRESVAGLVTLWHSNVTPGQSGARTLPDVFFCEANHRNCKKRHNAITPRRHNVASCRHGKSNSRRRHPDPSGRGRLAHDGACQHLPRCDVGGCAVKARAREIFDGDTVRFRGVIRIVDTVKVITGSKLSIRFTDGDTAAVHSGRWIEVIASDFGGMAPPLGGAK